MHGTPLLPPKGQEHRYGNGGGGLEDGLDELESSSPPPPPPQPPQPQPAAATGAAASKRGHSSRNKKSMLHKKQPSGGTGYEVTGSHYQHQYKQQSPHRQLSLTGASTPEMPKRRESSQGMAEMACDEGPGICAHLITFMSILLVFVTMPFSLCFAVKVVQEYERVVIFRLGRLLRGGARGPGIFFIVPCVDSYQKVDMRTLTFDVPPQEILTKDSVTVHVDAIMYYKVSNAICAISNVDDYGQSTRLLAATTLRNVLGTKNLGDILSDRDTIANMMQSTLDEATDPWGVKVERVEVKDVRLPQQLQRAMAAEAEAAREARAKVIAAEGEHQASRSLANAADVIASSPAALQLRYLQTLNNISAEKNSTIVFPVPVDILSNFMGRGATNNGQGGEGGGCSCCGHGHGHSVTPIKPGATVQTPMETLVQ